MHSLLGLMKARQLCSQQKGTEAAEEKQREGPQSQVLPAAPFPGARQGAEGLGSPFRHQQPLESLCCGSLLLSLGAPSCNSFQTPLGLVLYSLALP